ncbi:PAS domain S-box protein [Enterovibrio sp. ZSDZ35]|uniref:histidine kinase n=1 Tax=Enterovibrio qingdaonensis TaxID=2899818 RepID=A0ABT5QJE5_9GAMM|nr:PAS domain S-box protein [Enterovibrio sp. ZSDZ35]MDD1781115.1 PAS domain S-box protein [Enterovibrio sp. ZSDZ35]
MEHNNFGERLKSLLRKQKKTQAQVAHAIGTSIPSVNRWTKGGQIEYSNLRSLAQYLDVNWIWLRYGDEAIESLQQIPNGDTNAKDSRREYLNQIMDSEARMSQALEMADIITWEWNVLTGSVDCSSNASDFFGVEENNLPNCMLPYADMSIEELLSVFGADEPHTWDFSSETSQGALKWFNSKAKLYFDASGRPTKVIGICSEITTRKEVENALEKKELLLRRILETIPVGFWGADENGIINLTNPEAERIWGGSTFSKLEHYLNTQSWSTSDGHQLEASERPLARAIELKEATEPVVMTIKSLDGNLKTIFSYAAPLYNSHNEFLGAFEINQDITKIKNNEIKSLENDIENSLYYERCDYGSLLIKNGNIIRASRYALTLAKKKSTSLLNLELLFSQNTVLEIDRIALSETPHQVHLTDYGRDKDKCFQIYISSLPHASGHYTAIVFFAP